MFIPSVKLILSTGPVVLFVDGHHSHISVFYVFLHMPLTVTHMLQLLDVWVYEPLKTAWRIILIKPLEHYVFQSVLLALQSTPNDRNWCQG